MGPPSQSNEVEAGSIGVHSELYHRTDLQGNPGIFLRRFFPAVFRNPPLTSPRAALQSPLPFGRRKSPQKPAGGAFGERTLHFPEIYLVRLYRPKTRFPGFYPNYGEFDQGKMPFICSACLLIPHSKSPIPLWGDFALTFPCQYNNPCRRIGLRIGMGMGCRMWPKRWISFLRILLLAP